MNKTALACIFVLGSLPAAASVISGVTVTASSQFTDFPWSLRADNLVNGNGLSAGAHTTCYDFNTCWQNNATGFPDYLVFDLGSLYTVDNIHIWNGYWGNYQSGRSARTVDMLTSTDGTTWAAQGAFILAEAPTDTSNPYFGFDLISAPDSLGWADTRFVQFVLLDNWGGGDCGGCVTMAGVQFSSADSTVPEPASMSLLLLGAALVYAGSRYRSR